MTIDSTWCWASTAENFGRVEYRFIPIITKPTLVVHDRVLSIDQIYMFKNNSSSIGACVKKKINTIH